LNEQLPFDRPFKARNIHTRTARSPYWAQRIRVNGTVHSTEAARAQIARAATLSRFS
jgi:hypothetical protein